MQCLADVAPILLWKHFEGLSALPRVSCNEQALALYILSFAAGLGLPARKDSYGNVLVEKPATAGMETRTKIILQAHLDMVGQKAPESSHDFAKDPIRLIREGDWLRADGTTLGADNGIGVAAALAVLESKSLKHGPLAALFTVEEEIGLKGAAHVDPSFLDGSILINLDADAIDELTIGCAGALDIRASMELRTQICPADWKSVEVKLTGLQGGHSGADIHRGRANALRLLARMLARLGDQIEWRLSGFEGGDARNAIPREARALLVYPSSAFPSLTLALRTEESVLHSELALAEPGLRLELKQCAAPVTSIEWAASLRFLDLVRACPNGVVRFSEVHVGIVETSANLGIVSLGTDGLVAMQFLLRSLIDSAKADLGESLAGLLRLAGARLQIYGDYPGWQPDLTSRILPLFSEKCEGVLGLKPRTAVVHGGLECGILRALKPSLDCISYGACIRDMHSPKESVSISSVETFFRVLTEVLAASPTA